MRVGDEASAIAQAASAEESDSQQESNQLPVDDVARRQARGRRFHAGLALRKAMAAHAALSEALHAIASHGDPDLDLDSFYSDNTAIFDLVVEVDVVHANTLRWLSALEGRTSFAQLMLDGPPGFEAELLRDMNNTPWWTTADPDELKSDSGDVIDRSAVEEALGPLVAAADRGRRIMVTPDGHCWELKGPAEFDQGTKEAYESKHGTILELLLWVANPDDPASLVRVEEFRADGVRLVVPASVAQDYAALYRSVLAQREAKEKNRG